MIQYGTGRETFVQYPIGETTVLERPTHQPSYIAPALDTLVSPLPILVPLCLFGWSQLTRSGHLSSERTFFGAQPRCHEHCAISVPKANAWFKRSPSAASATWMLQVGIRGWLRGLPFFEAPLPTVQANSPCFPVVPTFPILVRSNMTGSPSTPTWTLTTPASYARVHATHATLPARETLELQNFTPSHQAAWTPAEVVQFKKPHDG